MFKSKLLAAAVVIAAALYSAPSHAAFGQVTFVEPYSGGVCRKVVVYYPSSGNSYSYVISGNYFLIRANAIWGTGSPAAAQMAATMFSQAVADFTQAFEDSSVNMNVYSTGTDTVCTGYGAIYDWYFSKSPS